MESWLLVLIVAGGTINSRLFGGCDQLKGEKGIEQNVLPNPGGLPRPSCAEVVRCKTIGRMAQQR